MRTIFAILVILFVAGISHVFAQAPTSRTYVLSAPLIEEVFGQLSKESYVTVAPLIGKLQTEIQRQPPPLSCPPPEPPTPEPPKKGK
jgi:hypothetical protein